MVLNKHLTHFSCPISLVLHQYMNSHVTYPDIPDENSNHTREQYKYIHQDLPPYHHYFDQSLTKVVHQKQDLRSVAQSYCAGIAKDGHYL